MLFAYWIAALLYGVCDAVWYVGDAWTCVIVRMIP